MTITCPGTTVEYNGITIHDVLTDEVNQEVVYDQTNTDPIGIRVSVTVTGYVHLSAQEQFGVKLSGSLAADMQVIQRALLTPRRNFTMSIGSQTWLSCAPYAAERCVSGLGGINGNPSDCRYWDIEAGPRPNLRVIGIVHTHSMKVKFSIQFCRSICNDQAAAYAFKGLMHLRMWITDEINCQDWTVTRTHQGVMRFYGSIPVADGQVAHQNLLARAFAIPPLQWGFQRKRILINEAPDGLSAEFQIVDQEVWAVAPAPATDWEGNFEVTIPYGGVSCESECRVTVRGGKMTPKWHLVRLVMKILDAKLRLTVTPINYIPMVYTLSEPLERNEVSGYARVKHLGEQNISAPLALSVFAANTNTWFRPFSAGTLDLTGLAPGTHNPYQFEHGYQGSSPDGATTIQWAPNSLVGLLIPALQTPCCPLWLTNNISGYAPASGSTLHSYPPEEGSQLLVGQSPGTLSSTTNPYSDDSREFFYWNAKLTSEYRTSTGLAAFPRAQASTTSPGPTISVVRMHAPYQFREVRFEFVRALQWPSIPKPRETWTDDNGLKHYLLGWTLAPNASSVGADGSSDIRSLVMVLHYALERPIDWDAGEAFPVGRLPERKPVNTSFQQLDPSAYAQLFKDEKEIIGVT